MNTHPEQRPGEVYLGNSDESGRMYIDWHTQQPYDPSGFKSSSWKTKRLGRVAYDADGQLIAGDDYRPWFVQRPEIEQAIATTKYEDTKKTLRDLVDRCAL